MKSLILSAFLLSSIVSGAILEVSLGKRYAQIPDLTSFMGAASKPTIVIDEKPQLRPHAKRQVLRFGPFTLPPLKVCRT